MGYPILDPDHPIPALGHLCALAVMAKAPKAGRVKTQAFAAADAGADGGFECLLLEGHDGESGDGSGGCGVDLVYAGWG